MASLTWWYEFYHDAVQPGLYIFKIQELHKQYIYAPSMTHVDKYNYQLRTLRVPGGVGTTADYYLHKGRR
ncbi:hypothetical protein EYZ11_011521 [Aspergillus tanneri]|uniref:Uncharacterized protein n=1 Tax=Aspergillus tanneri TaxID=1220188 RepID=A0A4S3J2N1_9EURO|nr:hypothetical protein EYZ11_011521 [Aspergillus tanneri]